MSIHSGVEHVYTILLDQTFLYKSMDVVSVKSKLYQTRLDESKKRVCSGVLSWTPGQQCNSHHERHKTYRYQLFPVCVAVLSLIASGSVSTVVASRSEASASDARVVLLESVYVVLTLHRGRQMGMTHVCRVHRGAPQCQQSTTRRTHTPTVGRVWTRLTWEMSSRREIPTLKSCPHFLCGRLRSVFLLRCVNGIGPEKLGTCWPKRTCGSCLD